MRGLSVLVVVGCGRVGFDPAGGDASGNGPSLAELGEQCAMWLRMDEPAWSGAAGEVRDSCGDNHGTVVGATTTTTSVSGKAAMLGDGSCITVPDAPALRATTALTISAWIRPTVADGNPLGIVSKRYDVNFEHAYGLILYFDNKAYVDIDSNNNRFDSVVAFARDEWHQVTVVYDGSLPETERSRLYVDGEVAITAPETSAAIPAYTSPLHVGCQPFEGALQHFIGQIDELVLWTRPLTAAHVGRWYEVTRP